MKPIRVLAIAPYQGMCSMIQQQAETMPEITLSAYVGDLEAGVNLVAEHEKEGYDIIVSRGGTANMIRQITSLPVIEIDISIYDILCSIRLAENSQSNYVIVGFPSITRNSASLCDVLHYSIPQYTIHSREEVLATLKNIRQDHDGIVLGDMLTYTIARELGMSAIMITSGSKSILSALYHAVHAGRLFRQIGDQQRLFQAIAEQQNETIVVMGTDGRLIYTNDKGQLPQEVWDKLKSIDGYQTDSAERSLMMTVCKQQCMVTQKQITLGDETYCMSIIAQRRQKLDLEKLGITAVNTAKAVDSYSMSFFNRICGSGTEVFQRHYNEKDALLLSGEEGIDLNQVALILFRQSDYQRKLLWQIDCASLQPKGWNYLVDCENSPLYDRDSVMHFEHLHSLSEQQLTELLGILGDMRLRKKRKVVFCLTNSEAALFRKAASGLSYTQLAIPPMRENLGAVPQLATICMEHMNRHNGTEIVGIEPDAMKTLMTYDWPENYTQFRRVMKQLVLAATTSYIQSDAVRDALAAERQVCAPQQSMHAEEYVPMTMAEIQLAAVHRALEAAGGRQSEAARMLGISRTTLWRMLNSEN